MENDALRTRIQRAISWLDQLEEDPLHEEPGLTPEQLAEVQKRREDRKLTTKDLIDQLSQLYLKKRVEISRLNYRIANLPQPLPQAERDASGKTLYDLLRRIDQLEAKVDRLADSIRSGRRAP
jgi:hypothetical protein